MQVLRQKQHCDGGKTWVLNSGGVNSGALASGLHSTQPPLQALVLQPAAGPRQAPVHPVASTAGDMGAVPGQWWPRLAVASPGAGSGEAVCACQRLL
jgi:hypothetical protein